MSGWQERRWGHLGRGLGIPKGRKSGGAGGRGSGQRRGRGRGGGSILGDGSLTESIDLSIFSSSNFATITTLDGRPLADYAFIFGYFSIATVTTGGADLVAELSVDGSTYRTGASEYRTASVDAGAGAVVDASSLKLSDGNHPWSVSFCLSSVGPAGPTNLRTREMNVTAGSPGKHVGRSVSVVSDTAIRFKNSAGSNWVSGTLFLMGILKGQTTVQSHDFGATPGSKIFDIPAGHRVATVHMIGGTTQFSEEIQIRVGTGDVFLTGSTDYRGSQMNQFGSSTFSTNAMGFTKSAFTGHDGWCELWGFRTLAPISQFAMIQETSGTDPNTLSHLTTPTPTELDQIQVLALSGNITGGTVYVVSYASDTNVEVVDFASAAAASHDFTDLSSYPATIVCAPTLTLATAQGIFSRVSTDGISFDAGAIDYRHHGMAHDFDFAVTRNNMEPGAGAFTTHGFNALYGGFGTNTHLQMTDGHTIRGSASQAINDGGIRLTDQVNTAIRIFNGGGINFTAGKLYRVGFTF